MANEEFEENTASGGSPLNVRLGLNVKRQCHECGAEIMECMGFVNAGDYMKALDAQTKEVPFQVPRELCGKCGVKKLFDSRVPNAELTRRSTAIENEPAANGRVE